MQKKPKSETGTQTLTEDPAQPGMPPTVWPVFETPSEPCTTPSMRPTPEIAIEMIMPEYMISESSILAQLFILSFWSSSESMYTQAARTVVRPRAAPANQSQGVQRSKTAILHLRNYEFRHGIYE